MNITCPTEETFDHRIDVVNVAGHFYEQVLRWVPRQQVQSHEEKTELQQVFHFWKIGSVASAENQPDWPTLISSTATSQIKRLSKITDWKQLMSFRNKIPSKCKLFPFYDEIPVKNLNKTA